HTRCLSDWSSDVCSSDLETVVVAAEAQERHPLFVDVGDLEAEHARVEIDHFREVAAVQADVADLAYADGVGGVGHVLPPAGENRSEERRVGKEGRGGWWE